MHNGDLVLLNGAMHSRALAEHAPRQWQGLLQRAYLSGVRPACLCCGRTAPLEMYVARCGQGYTLKRLPNTGPRHAPGCPSHGDWQATAAPPHGAATGSPGEPVASAASATRDAGDPPVLRLTTPLRESRHPGPIPVARRRAPRSRSPSRSSGASLSLDGLLELLWSAALPAGALLPGSLGALYERLREQALRYRIGAHPASLALYVPDTHLDEAAQAAKCAAIDARFAALDQGLASDERPWLLVLGELLSLYPARYSWALRLKGLPRERPIWVSAAALPGLRASAPQTWARRRQGAADAQATRLFVLAAVAAGGHGLLWRCGTERASGQHFETLPPAASPRHPAVLSG